MSGDRSRRGSALLNELNRAEAKLGSLEEFIRERERQLHVAVSRLHGGGNAGRRSSRSRYANRRRRAGITGDALLRMRNSINQESFEQLDDDVYMQPLGDYASLRLIRVEENSSEGHIPFLLSRLVGRHYHVGPEGATIGTSAECSVCVTPKESEVWPRHALISGVVSKQQAQAVTTSLLTRQLRIDNQGWFDLCDLTEGQSVFKILPMPMSATSPPTAHPTFQMRVDQFEDTRPASTVEHDQSEDGTTESSQFGFRTRLSHGIQFQTGRLVWSLTALPLDQVLTIKMFSAARERRLSDLRTILESSQCINRPTPFVFVTPPPQYDFSTLSIMTEDGIDVNTEYRPPTSDDVHLSQRPSSTLSPSSLSPVAPLPHLSPYLLLHIAVVNNDLDMVLYLLDKGADVNLVSGPLSLTSLHLASRLGLPDILYHLLARGGDVESKDLHNLTPLEVTSNYEIRKLLLNSVLLCAASEAGDEDEVTRLLTRCGVPVNVCGLRHKAPLHLASSQGHAAVVDILLANGANVNSRGGSNKRTPLHYASLYNHVAIATTLLGTGANEHARDARGLTPLNLSMGGDMCKLLHKQPLSLCLAVQGDDIQRVHQLLCDNEAQCKSADNLVDQRNEQSHAPLHIACTAGNMEMVELLISHGADVNLRGGCDGWTPLFYAAMAGHSGLVEFLLTVGASTEEVDGEGVSVEERVQGALEEVQDRLKQLEKTTHELATSPGEEPSMNTLKPIVMSRRESGTCYSTDSDRVWLLRRYDQLKAVSAVLTPAHERLMKSIDARNLSDFVQVLDGGSVSPDILVDRHYPVPVLTKTIQHGLFQFAGELIKRGANVSPSGPADQIPLLVAAENGHSDILQLLISHGATVNIQSADTQSSALHEAATAGSIESVMCLLSNGADRTALNCNGETPFDCTTELEIRKLLAVGADRLLVAACTGDSDIIRTLVNEEGFSPSHEFQQGVTALHEACESGHEECVHLLLELEAEVNKQTHMMQATPLHIASRNNYLDIASALLRAGAKLDLKDSDGKVPFEVASTNQMRKIVIEARSLHVAPVQYQRETSRESRLCKICMDNTINTIVLPCGHQAFCTSCVSHISVCALDRTPIKEIPVLIACEFPSDYITDSKLTCDEKRIQTWSCSWGD